MGRTHMWVKRWLDTETVKTGTSGGSYLVSLSVHRSTWALELLPSSAVLQLYFSMECRYWLLAITSFKGGYDLLSSLY